ncbi:glycosyltransferase family 4 protein [Tranquillimonas rosea]|uniref:glycosyltransferase family 4 protein n=1 Tax=Tranquillimonas rosea TaxID=641238 RepID=UPI003BABE4D2
MEKELLPWLPWALEKQFFPKNVPLITDYDDAIFHRYDCHRSRIVRGVLGRKIDEIMARSDIVFAGNDYLASRAREAGAQDVRVVPTVVDMEKYSSTDGSQNPVVKSKALSRGPVVGWIGTPVTWKEYGSALALSLETTLRAQNSRLSAIGASLTYYRDSTVEFVPWSEDTEVSNIQNFDIGIMPLDDSPWSQGKCGYKLIQYMACGVPVIASPVGVNKDIVEPGHNGLFASTAAEWIDAVNVLLGDSELRAKMGAAGRKKVEEEYSVQAWGPWVAELIKDTALGR